MPKSDSYGESRKIQDDFPYSSNPCDWGDQGSKENPTLGDEEGHPDDTASDGESQRLTLRLPRKVL